MQTVKITIRMVKSKRVMGKPCSTNGGEEECMWNIGGKPEGKKQLGRERHRLVDNIKMDLREIGCCLASIWV
jgi:hypothetical protein